MTTTHTATEVVNACQKGDMALQQIQRELETATFPVAKKAPQSLTLEGFEVVAENVAAAVPLSPTSSTRPPQSPAKQGMEVSERLQNAQETAALASHILIPSPANQLEEVLVRRAGNRLETLISGIRDMAIDYNVGAHVILQRLGELTVGAAELQGSAREFGAHQAQVLEAQAQERRRPVKLDGVPLSIAPEDVNQEEADALILMFGKHAGKTFKQTTEEHPEYCKWIMDNKEKGTHAQVDYYRAYLHKVFELYKPNKGPIMMARRTPTGAVPIPHEVLQPPRVLQQRANASTAAPTTAMTSGGSASSSSGAAAPQEPPTWAIQGVSKGKSQGKGRNSLAKALAQEVLEIFAEG